MAAVRLDVSEKELQQQVTDAARLYGWLCYHTFDSRRSAAGFPDLVLVHKDRGVLFVELKSSRGRVSAAQQLWLDTLTEAGAEALLVRPDGLEALIRRLAPSP